VTLDVFAEHLDPRIEQLVIIRRSVFDRGDQLLTRAVLDLGLVEQVPAGVCDLGAWQHCLFFPRLYLNDLEMSPK
jgi:hypothetical protein